MLAAAIASDLDSPFVSNFVLSGKVMLIMHNVDKLLALQIDQ